VVRSKSTPSATFEIRSFDGGHWWPVELSGPLTPDRFRSLAADGNEALITAMGVKKEYGRVTIEEFTNWTPIRDVRNSTREDARARIHRGAARTIFAGGRVLFEAGPPAFFRPYHVPDMTIGPLGLAADDYGNDGSYGCYIPGPPRHIRLDCGGAGRAIGLDEIEVERTQLPDRLYAPDVGQTIEVIRDTTPAGAATLFCEREFPKRLRSSFEKEHDGGTERAELFASIAPELGSWLRSPDTPESTRWLLRRCAYGTETEFQFELHGVALAARSILRRLASYGLEGQLEEADEAAMQWLSEVS
jgi:hypothetical protein